MDESRIKTALESAREILDKSKLDETMGEIEGTLAAAISRLDRIGNTYTTADADEFERARRLQEGLTEAHAATKKVRAVIRAALRP